MRAVHTLALATLALFASCASGPKYAEVEGRIPELAPETGRVFFYRPSSLGAAVQPAVELNGEEVGSAVPKGFFFVDRQPGDYVVRCSTEAKHELSFTLAAREVRYVKLVIQMGLFVGRVQPELVGPSEALEDLESMSYIGAETGLLPETPEP